MDPAERGAVFNGLPDLDEPVEADGVVDGIVGLRPSGAKSQGGMTDESRIDGPNQTAAG